MAAKKTIKITKRPASKSGSAPGSGKMGPYFGGVRNNPALFPSTKEQ